LVNASCVRRAADVEPGHRPHFLVAVVELESLLPLTCAHSAWSCVTRNPCRGGRLCPTNTMMIQTSSGSTSDERVHPPGRRPRKQRLVLVTVATVSYDLYDLLRIRQLGGGILSMDGLQSAPTTISWRRVLRNRSRVPLRQPKLMIHLPHPSLRRERLSRRRGWFLSRNATTSPALDAALLQPPASRRTLSFPRPTARFRSMYFSPRRRAWWRPNGRLFLE